MEKGKNFDFAAYKKEATINDVAALKESMKPRWYEHIPVIGCIIYLIRTGIEISGIDRGPLRKAITRYHVYFLFGMLVYPYTILVLLTPLLFNKVLKVAIKKTEEQIKKGDI